MDAADEPMEVDVGAEANERKRGSPGGPAAEEQQPEHRPEKEEGACRAWRSRLVCVLRLATTRAPEADERSHEDEQREHRETAEVKEASREEQLHDSARPKGVDLPPRLPAVGAYEVGVREQGHRSRR